MLACVLLAVAVAPVASVEGAPSRPAVTLVLRLSSVEAHASAPVVAQPRRVTASAPVVVRDVGWRARLNEPRERARAWPAPDQRYLYLSNATLLC